MMEKTIYGVAIGAVVVIGMGAGPNVLGDEAFEVNGSLLCNAEFTLKNFDCLDNTPFNCSASWTMNKCQNRDGITPRYRCIIDAYDACQSGGCLDDFDDDRDQNCTDPE